MPRVYILNKGAHDYSAAERFGELVYITTGILPKYSTGVMFRQVEEGLKNSKPADYIVLSSLTTLCVIACCHFVSKHGRLNLLIFKDNDYINRTMLFPTLKQLIEITNGN
jgi:hypothetical protein